MKFLKVWRQLSHEGKCHAACQTTGFALWVYHDYERCLQSVCQGSHATMNSFGTEGDNTNRRTHLDLE